MMSDDDMVFELEPHCTNERQTVLYRNHGSNAFYSSRPILETLANQRPAFQAFVNQAEEMVKILFFYSPKVPTSLDISKFLCRL